MPLPNTTKSLVLMLAISALVTVVWPGDSTPNELVLVRGRMITAPAPPLTTPPARLSASAVKIVLAMPPLLLIVALFVRLLAVRLMGPLLVLMLARAVIASLAVRFTPPMPALTGPLNVIAP